MQKTKFKLPYRSMKLWLIVYRYNMFHCILHTRKVPCDPKKIYRCGTAVLYVFYPYVLLMNKSQCLFYIQSYTAIFWLILKPLSPAFAAEAFIKANCTGTWLALKTTGYFNHQYYSSYKVRTWPGLYSFCTLLF